LEPITLNWKGPYSLEVAAGRKAFDPPPKSGVYLWCVGKPEVHRLAYVGEAENIRERLYQHLYSLLGGHYGLFENDHLLKGLKPVEVYEGNGNLENLVQKFVGEFERYSALALHNVTSYRFFWAVLENEPKSRRRAVESALIKRGLDRQEPLQNRRLSRRAEAVRIISTFEAGVDLPALREEINCPEL